MCGIVGSIGSQFTQKNIEQSLKKLSHRGPDEKITQNIPQLKTKLGMVRLSIQDLSQNLYPFSYKDRYLLIYNGEVYNKNELWKKINKIKPKTSCDAEVILPLFDKYGPKMFGMLQGMFAIAILDKQLNKLYLARDKFGEKPLYYYFDEDGLYFSSELKAFPDEIKKFSHSRIPDYLSFGFLPEDKTFFKNISKLKAGQFLEYDCQLNYWKINYYYRLSDDLKKNSPNYNPKKLKNDLEKVVKKKLISDVPVGTFLSGGLDSSLITAITKKHHDHTLHTFSVKFPGSKYDESSYSSHVAKQLKTEHHLVSVTAKKVKKSWSKFIQNMDQPSSDPALVPTFFLAQTAKKYVTVILSGEGMDEFFSGYSRYEKEHRVLNAQQQIPSVLQKIGANYSKKSGNYKLFNAFSSYSHHYTSTFLNTLWIKDKRQRLKYIEKIKKSWFDLFTYLQDFDDPDSNKKIIQSIQLYDLHYYVADQLCMKLDKMTMIHSIEGRAPYLDSVLLKYLPLSTAESIKHKKSKSIVRDIASEFIPESIAQRPKHGFTVPLDDWLNTELEFLIKKLIKNPHPYIIKYVDPKTISKLLKLTSGGDVGSSMSLWSIIVLDQWLKKHLK